MVSLRVVWAGEGKFDESRAEFIWLDVEEVRDFFEACKEELRSSSPFPEKIAVIAVGDFPQEEMAAVIEESFGGEQIFLPQKAHEAVVVEKGEHLAHAAISFGFPLPVAAVKTSADLRKRWIAFFLHDLVSEHLQNHLAQSPALTLSEVEPWTLFPPLQCCAKATADADNALVVLAWYLVAVQELKQGGFTNQEFAAVRSRIYLNLLAGRMHEPDSKTLADYFASHIVPGAECLSYEAYMEASLEIVASLTLSEIEEQLGDFLKDAKRCVHLQEPSDQPIGASEVKAVLNKFLSDHYVLTRQDLNDVKGQQLAIFNQLPMTEEEAKIIGKLIETIATNNPLVLGLNKASVEKMGTRIAHIHPLRFLGTIFSDPDLKEYMREIRDSIFKWGAFLKGLSEQMEAEANRNNLSSFTLGFCQVVGADPERIRGYFQKQDWEKLLEYLIGMK